MALCISHQCLLAQDGINVPPKPYCSQEKNKNSFQEIFNLFRMSRGDDKSLELRGLVSSHKPDLVGVWSESDTRSVASRQNIIFIRKSDFKLLH